MIGAFLVLPLPPPNKSPPTESYITKHTLPYHFFTTNLYNEKEFHPTKPIMP
jgi:hypothetical protein